MRRPLPPPNYDRQELEHLKQTIYVLVGMFVVLVLIHYVDNLVYFGHF